MQGWRLFMADNSKDDILTVEGKKALEERLRYLEDVARPQNLEDLKLARSQGDLSENADYDAAKSKQSEIEAEIQDIEYKLRNYKVVQKNEKVSSIQIESVVTLTNLSNQAKMTVKIVGPTETDLSDPNLFKIASDCPLGKAILGHLVGDVVDVEAPKPYKVKIEILK